MISGQTMGIISLTRHLETIIIMQARGTWYTISRSRVQGSGFRFFVHRCPYDEIMEKNEGKRRVHGKLWLWITCHTLGCTLCVTPSVNAALARLFFTVPTVSPRIALCLRKCNLAKEKKHSKLSYLQRKMSVHSWIKQKFSCTYLGQCNE